MAVSERRWILAIFAMAIGVRLAAFWLLPEPHMAYNAIFAYVKGADSLVSGQGFSDPSFPVYTPPLYSVLIAAGTVLFGDGIYAIKVLQVIADAFTSILLYLIARRIFDNFIAVFTGILWSLYPFAIYATLYVGTEVFFTLFIAVFLLFLIYSLEQDKWYFYFGAGLFLGLATLIRGTTQFLPLILPLALWLLKSKNSPWLRNYTVSVLCFLIVILPWAIRNYIVLHEIIPVGANSTVMLYGTYEPLLTIDTRQAELVRVFEAAKAKGIVPPGEDRGPSERDGFLAKVAIQNYRDRLQSDPFGLAVFMVQKFFRLWYSTESGNNHGITLAVNAGVYAFALIGIVVTFKKKNKMAIILVGILGYFVIIHWLTLPLFRYMLPVMPYVLIMTAVGIVFVIEKGSPEAYRRLTGMFQMNKQQVVYSRQVA